METIRPMRELDCTDIKVLTSGLIDDEVDGATRHAAERHLATCKACRDAIGVAELAMQIVAAEAAQAVPDDRLPDGFVGAVLSRTVYTEKPRAGAAAWLGWLAAAAALALAVTSWLAGPGAGRSGAPAEFARGGDSRNSDAPPGSAVVSGSPAVAPEHLRSAILDDDAADLPARTRRLVTFGPPDPYFDGVAVSLPLRTLPRAMPLRDDVETLDSTATMFEIVLAASAGDFTRIEEARSIAEYDGLLSRLAVAKNRLDVADRPLVLNAASLVHRIVNGPIDGATVDDLRRTIEDLDLVERLGEIVRRWNDTMAM